MKIFWAILGVFFAIVVTGLMLPDIIPKCHCGLDSGCRGCGGVVGNAVGSFALTCFALGGIGFVLLMWFGFPAAILGLVVYRVFKLLSTKPESRDTYEDQGARAELLQESGDEASRNTGAAANGLCPNCKAILPISAERCSKCSAEFGPGSSWKVEMLGDQGSVPGHS